MAFEQRPEEKEGEKAHRDGIDEDEQVQRP